MLQDAEQILVDQSNDNAKVERISAEAVSQVLPTLSNANQDDQRSRSPFHNVVRHSSMETVRRWIEQGVEVAVQCVSQSTETAEPVSPGVALSFAIGMLKFFAGIDLNLRCPPSARRLFRRTRSALRSFTQIAYEVLVPGSHYHCRLWILW